MMNRLTVVVGLGSLLLASPVDAQWKYTDDKGATKLTQYKLDIPQRHRDVAVWAGPTGVGRRGLSEEERQWRQRDGVCRPLGESELARPRYRRAVEPGPRPGPARAKRRPAV